MEKRSSKSNRKILITGGSGLVGKYLTSALLLRGYEVSHLSRESNQFGRVRVHRWDPAKKIIDPLILENIDTIIHLAGANIGTKRWSQKRREEIINSRVEPLELLYKVVRDNNLRLKTLISASATGYYGAVTSEKIFKEEDSAASDFLGSTCTKWEEAAGLFSVAGIRTVKIRTAVVLDRESSALSGLLRPLKSGFVIRIGSGKQYFPWIHISDLCDIYIKAVEDINLDGAYNAVSPQHTDHDTFMKTLAGIMNKPLAWPHIPGWSVRLAMGEMADIVLEGTRVSSEKITASGFVFRYEKLYDALNDILEKT